DRVAQQVQQENYELSTIDLTEAEHGAYYNGYSNEVLWPVLHYRPDLMNYHSSHFEAYRRVNELFADHLAQHVRSNDLLCTHDYHLMLAAQELRKRGIDHPIGFFLHTPLPPPEVFTTLPNHRELMAGLCHCDLVGFQTPTDFRAF